MKVSLVFCPCFAAVNGPTQLGGLTAAANNRIRRSISGPSDAKSNDHIPWTLSRLDSHRSLTQGRNFAVAIIQEAQFLQFPRCYNYLF